MTTIIPARETGLGVGQSFGGAGALTSGTEEAAQGRRGGRSQGWVAFLERVQDQAGEIAAGVF